MHLKSGEKLKSDCLLYANGRTANTDSLALENVRLDAQNDGLASLALVACDQRRIAAQAKGEATTYLIKWYPNWHDDARN